MDGFLLRHVNHWPEWLAPAMEFFSTATDRGWFKILLVLLVIAMVIWRPNTRRAAVQALIAFPLANEVTDWFKAGLPMPRPCNEPVALTDLIVRIGCSDSAGTASAHSANMAAVAVAFTYHLKWWGAPWIAIAFLTGLSRIYNGMHYPYQVLLGWTVGALVALAVCKAWDLIQTKRNRVVTETESIETKSDSQQA